MIKDQKRPKLPEEFELLSDKFFSIGLNYWTSYPYCIQKCLICFVPRVYKGGTILSLLSSTSSFAASNVRSLAFKAYQDTMLEKYRVDKIEAIAKNTESLFSLIYGYTIIDESEGLDTDDEILNWTFVDVIDDLNAANWNIACGFYKAAASCLRNALDISNAALYFQIKENEHRHNNGSGYNPEFSKWDSGENKTPNWGITNNLISNQPSVKKFNNEHSWKFPSESHKFYHYLCNFTHGRPFAEDSTPTNSINLGYNAPEFSADLFERFTSLADKTIAWIATMWLITYPQILANDPLMDPTSLRYQELMATKEGKDAFEFAKKIACGK